MDKSQPTTPSPPAVTETDYPEGVYPPPQVNTSATEYSPPAECEGQSGNLPNPAQQSQSTPATVNGTPQVPHIPQTYGWWKDIQRNEPQSSSLATASFIFTSGGMSLVWSVLYPPGYRYLSKAARIHTQICWFLAIIIGASICATFIEKITKRVFNVVASVLVLVNGILFILAPENSTAAIIARYCDGIAFGLAVIPTIVVGSEQSVKRFRGNVLSVEQVSLIAGMAIYLFFKKNNSNRIHGILALIYGTLALGFTFVYTMESPISYLRKSNEAKAINALCLLQKPTIVTTETYDLLNEHKHLLEEDNARGRNVNASASLIPMIKVCLFRAFVTMSLSVPLTWAFVQTLPSNNPNDLSRLYMFAAMRLIGVLLAKFTLDTLGRKRVSVFSLIVGGGLLIGVATIFAISWDDVNRGPPNTAKILLMAYQVFAGLIAPASTCYLGEAFSISVKPYFILVAVIFENVIQVTICCLCILYGTMRTVSEYGYALGVLQIAFAIFFIFGIPETKQTTLREALAKFTKVINVQDRL